MKSVKVTVAALPPVGVMVSGFRPTCNNHRHAPARCGEMEGSTATGHTVRNTRLPYKNDRQAGVHMPENDELWCMHGASIINIMQTSRL